MIRNQTFYDYLIFLSYFSFWSHFSRFFVDFFFSFPLLISFHFCVLLFHSLVTIIWSIRCRYGFKCCVVMASVTVCNVFPIVFCVFIFPFLVRSSRFILWLMSVGRLIMGYGPLCWPIEMISFRDFRPSVDEFLPLCIWNCSVESLLLMWTNCITKYVSIFNCPFGLWFRFGVCPHPCSVHFAFGVTDGVAVKHVYMRHIAQQLEMIRKLYECSEKKKQTLNKQTTSEWQ